MNYLVKCVEGKGGEPCYGWIYKRNCRHIREFEAGHEGLWKAE
jgi:hypothetical protein